MSAQLNGFGEKTPITMLNELRQGQVVYALVKQTGPPHQPLFTMACRVDGREFLATAGSKQLAKQDAARLAVAAVLAKSATSARPSAAPVTAGSKRHAPLAAIPDLDFNGSHPAKMPRLETPPPPPPPPPPPTSSASKSVPSEADLATKNPISIINELRPGGVTFHLAETKEVPGCTPRFVMQCVVDGYAYKAEAGNKKVAKMRAAQVALRELFHLMSTYAGAGDSAAATHQVLAATPAEQAFADSVQSLVRSRFDELAASLPERLARRKVLAGVVMCYEDSPGSGGVIDPSQLTVLCVTTGTKCLSGDRLEATGGCLLDCHAEILSRRCLLRVFHSQLAEAAGDSPDRSMFYRPADGAKFRLRPDISLHLYISTSPCGDARVFSPNEPVADGADAAANSHLPEDEHPTRASRGLLRTKIECGEGTIPVPANLVAQTWDGILGGERLLTMSCSDKLASWCMLGLQGCLLSQLVEPVYLSSIVIGSAFNPSHCRRALIGRLQQPPPGLPVSQPALLGVTERDPRQPRAAPDCSLNWCVLDDQPELVNSSTGRLLPTSGAQAEAAVSGVSRLSKRALFADYADLLRTLQHKFKAGSNRQSYQQQLYLPPVIRTGPSGTTYRQAKLACREYRSSKAAMVAFLRNNGRGLWAAKPFELQEFTL